MQDLRKKFSSSSISCHVAPSMLSCDFSNIEKEIKALEASDVQVIHWDVMDGHFVPNLTFGAPIISKCRKVTGTFFDVHLMIEEPEKYLKDFIKAGADLLTLHVESSNKIKECFELLDTQGVKKGITLRPGTPLEKIKPYLDQVDLVLVMTVEPGFGGQSFMEDQVKKINELYNLRSSENFKYLIEVDGGINNETAIKAKNADLFVAGSFVFKNSNYKDAIDQINRVKA